jgi:hypothetical protein
MSNDMAPRTSATALACRFLNNPNWQEYALDSERVSLGCYVFDSGYEQELFTPWCDSPQWARAWPLSRLHDHTQLDKPHLVGLPWKGDQPDGETST